MTSLQRTLYIYRIASVNNLGSLCSNSEGKSTVPIPERCLLVCSETSHDRDLTISVSVSLPVSFGLKASFFKKIPPQDFAWLKIKHIAAALP